MFIATVCGTPYSSDVGSPHKGKGETTEGNKAGSGQVRLVDVRGRAAGGQAHG